MYSSHRSTSRCRYSEVFTVRGSSNIKVYIWIHNWKQTILHASALHGGYGNFCAKRATSRKCSCCCEIERLGAERSCFRDGVSLKLMYSLRDRKSAARLSVSSGVKSHSRSACLAVSSGPQGQCEYGESLSCEKRLEPPLRRRSIVRVCS